MNTEPHSVLQVHAFYRQTTGADRYFRDLSTLLEAHGHRVVPFCARHAGDDPSEFSRYFPEGSLSAPDDHPGPLRAIRDAGKFLYHRQARRRAAEIVRDFRPEVVHVHNLFHHLSPAVLAPLRAGGSPVVMTLHDYKLICPNYSLYTQGAPCTACRGGRFHEAVKRRCVRDSRLKSALCAAENALHWRWRWYLDGVDRFVAPSRFLAERFVEFGFPPGKIRVLPNFTTLPAAGAGAEGDFVLFAGRLVAVKGVRTLLDAWQGTRARRTLRLLVAGAGPLERELRERAAAMAGARVEILGALDRAALFDRMARAVLQVVPSSWYENCPQVVLEAQARGRCVVASAIGGMPELVEDGVTGVLVPAGDALALAAAIDACVDQPALRAAIGARARAQIAERHSPDVHYRSIVEIYGAALDAGRGGAAPP